LESKRRSEIRPAAKPFQARAQVAKVHVNGRNVRVAHMRDQRDAARYEPTFGFGRTRDLPPGLLRKHAPDMTDVHADFLEHASPHQARFSAALSAVARWPAPGAGLEAAGRLESLERRANPFLQVTKKSRRGIGEVLRAVNASCTHEEA